MKAKAVLSGLLLLSTLFAVSTSQSDDGTQDAVDVIEVNEAKEFVTHHDNAVIIDVRTPLEYEMSHISGAINVDVRDEFFRQTAGTLDRNKTYIVHCTKNPAGGRSSRALETLQELGFKSLYSLEGGYLAWKDAELPLTEPSE